MSIKHDHKVHKYYRVIQFDGKILWTCALPQCTHHMPKHYEATMLGKAFYCWNCGDTTQFRLEHLSSNPDKDYFSEGDINFPSHPICYKCANPAIAAFSDDVIKQALGEK